MAEALLNYTTKVPVSQTIGEIIDILVRAGATDIAQSYRDRRPVAVKFIVPTPFGRQLFELPARTGGVLAVLKRQHAQGRMRTHVPLDEAHAEKVAWRILKDWLEAQIALISTEMATLDQLLIGFRIMDSGRSLYEEVVAAEGQLPPGATPPLLPEGRG